MWKMNKNDDSQVECNALSDKDSWYSKQYWWISAAMDANNPMTIMTHGRNVHWLGPSQSSDVFPITWHWKELQQQDVYN